MTSNRYLFRDWKLSSIVAGFLPFAIQNAFLLFLVAGGEYVNTIIFYLFPLVFAIIFAGVIGWSNFIDALGFDVTNRKILLKAVAFGVGVGLMMYVVGQLANIKIIPYAEHFAIAFSEAQPNVNPSLKIAYTIVFMFLVALGEEIICYIAMATTANWLLQRGFTEQQALILGAVLSRTVWGFTHWASWNFLGIPVEAIIASIITSVIVGVSLFTWGGLILYEYGVKEYLIYAPLLAHFVYNTLVTMRVFGIVP